VELFKKSDSQFWWFDFKGRGKRYRGSTKETNQKRAAKVAALKLAQALEGSDPLNRKAPVLAEFAKQFTEWLKTARLEGETQRYYLNGWRLLQTTKIKNVRLDAITADMVEALRFKGSPANGTTRCARCDACCTRRGSGRSSATFRDSVSSKKKADF
jgi:hypothetical protein